MTLTKETRYPPFVYLLLLSFLVLAAYSNAFYASWHLDDLSNILTNDLVQIEDLSFSTLTRTFFACPEIGTEGTLYRPLAMLSFALNWYISGDDIFSYHAVNISIHILTAFFLYLTILHLLTRTLYAGRKSIPHAAAEYTAFFAALLWALAPIQTQAVTYIVQRMASMSAMFYVMAMFFYLQGRIAERLGSKIAFFATVVLCFLLAVSSKEIAYTLPVALLLMEFLFLRDFSRQQTRKSFVVLCCISCFLLFLFCYLIVLGGKPFAELFPYDFRPFTIVERLLTEPRIVLNYLFQIFLPLTSNLSIDHDVILSRSLFDPWTTLPAILLLVFLLIVSLLLARKATLFSFAVLFFFLNHLIESTVLPLELVFEHRNYLPSMFLFVPVAQGLLWGIFFFQGRSPLLAKALSLFSLLLVGVFAFSTFSRNMVYLTEGTLWEDTLRKAPHSSRAAHNLGRWYRDQGKLEEALALFELSEKFAGQSGRPTLTKISALNGQGGVYALMDRQQLASAAFKEALAVWPDSEASRNNLVLSLLRTEQWAEALQESTILLEKHGHEPYYLYLHATALLKNGQPEAAKASIEAALKQSPDNTSYLLAKATICKVLKQYDESKDILYHYDTIRPGELAILLTLLEISILEQNDEASDKYKKQILQNYTVEDVTRVFSDKQLIALYSIEIVRPVFEPDLSEAALKPTD